MIRVYVSRSTPNLNLPYTLRFRTYYCVPGDPQRKHRANGPKPVCKQIWFETSQMFLSSAVFDMLTPLAFRTLAVSSPKWIQHIRQIRVSFEGYGALDYLKVWADSLEPSLVRRLTHLQGVTFEIRVYGGKSLLTRPDIMTDKEWKKTHLPPMMKSLQQHRLKPELTSFTWEAYSYDDSRVFLGSAAINEAIRTELLKYRPQRVFPRTIARQSE